MAEKSTKKEKKLTELKLKKIFGKSTGKFLSKLDFWLKTDSGFVKYGRRFVWKTVVELSKDLEIGRNQAWIISKALRNAGIVDCEQISKHNGDTTLYYSINYEKLYEFINLGLKFSLKTYFFSYAKNNKKIDEECETLYKDNSLQITDNKLSYGESLLSDKSYKSYKSVSIFSKNEKTETNENNKKSGQALACGQASPDLKYEIKSDEMLRIINEKLNKNFKIDKKIAKFLVSTYKFYWKSREGLEIFCEIIKSSRFLMSKSFKMSIFWLLKFSVLNEIMNGGYGCATESEIVNADGLNCGNCKVNIKAERKLSSPNKKSADDFFRSEKLETGFNSFDRGYVFDEKEDDDYVLSPQAEALLMKVEKRIEKKANEFKKHIAKKEKVEEKKERILLSREEIARKKQEFKNKFLNEDGNE